LPPIQNSQVGKRPAIHHQRKPTAPRSPHTPTGAGIYLVNPQTHGPASAAHRALLVISENSVFRVMLVMYVRCVSPSDTVAIVT
jgi:hypothetical protein